MADKNATTDVKRGIRLTSSSKSRRCHHKARTEFDKDCGFAIGIFGAERSGRHSTGDRRKTERDENSQLTWAAHEDSRAVLAFLHFGRR